MNTVWGITWNLGGTMYYATADGADAAKTEARRRLAREGQSGDGAFVSRNDVRVAG